ncbi:hypothetical protein C8R44DRAFT_775248 [Mycena epipterygia]|nr:hypothetical protein C8R44DRAFT_775248 [Mycena epipterygia]
MVYASNVLLLALTPFSYGGQFSISCAREYCFIGTGTRVRCQPGVPFLMSQSPRALLLRRGCDAKPGLTFTAILNKCRAWTSLRIRVPTNFARWRVPLNKP